MVPAGAFFTGASSYRTVAHSDWKDQEFRAVRPEIEGRHALRQLDDGDWMIEVTMIETGEKAEYRWMCLCDDPEAH